jgi:hypothetical protein
MASRYMRRSPRLTGTSRTRRAGPTGRCRMRRCMRSSTISSGRSAPTYTGAGCTRRWCCGRPRAPRPMSRQCSGTMLGSGGQLRRSCTPGRFRRYPARGRGSSASSIETPSGGSSSPRGPTSQSGVPSSLDTQIGAGLVDECHLFLCPIVVRGGKRPLADNVRARLELLDERRFRNGVVHLHYRVSV